MQWLCNNDNYYYYYERKSSEEIKELNIIDKCVSNKYESPLGYDRNPKVKSILVH